MRRIVVVFSLLFVVACASTPGLTADNVQATIARAVQATLTTFPTATPPPTLRPSPTRPSPTPLPPSPTSTVTPFSPQPLPPAQSWPSDVAQVLPAPLYYLSDVTGSQQIWRVETDGSSGAMITNLPQPVNAYDVSPVTGRIAYISNNQLFISDALGRDPQRIDTPNEDLSDLYASVAWSPNGTRLAFTAKSGVWLYDVNAQNLRPLSSQPGDILRLDAPTSWSPDGQTLLINSLSADSGEVNYLPLDGSTSLIRVGLSICDEVRWSRDSHTLYGSRDTLYGPCDDPGLVRWEMGGHTVMPLIVSEWITPTQHVLARFVRAAQEAPDGSLYYFYGSADLPYSDTAGTLFMVRSAPEGVTDRLALRYDRYTDISEVLWTPEMSAAVIVENADSTFNEKWQMWQRGGTLLLLTTDNKPAWSLPGHGSQLHWGKTE